jgi:hypothetical protein
MGQSKARDQETNAVYYVVPKPHCSVTIEYLPARVNGRFGHGLFGLESRRNEL